MIVREASIEFFTKFRNETVERTGHRRGEIGIFTVFRPFVVEIDSVELVLFDSPGENFGELILIGLGQVGYTHSLVISENRHQHLAAVLTDRLHILVVTGRRGPCIGNENFRHIVVEPQSRFGAVCADVGGEDGRDVDKRLIVHTIEHRIQRVGVVDLDIHHNFRGLVTVSPCFSTRSCCIHFRLHSVLCARRYQSSRHEKRTQKNKILFHNRLSFKVNKLSLIRGASPVYVFRYQSFAKVLYPNL